MMQKKVFSIFYLIHRCSEKYLYSLLISISICSLLFLFLVTVVDVFGRYFFNSPVKGATELIEHSVAILISSVIPFISWQNKQISVDLLDGKLKKIFVVIQNIFANIFSASGYYVVSIRIFEFAERSSKRGQVTEYLEIPTSLIQNFVATMLLMTSITILFFYLIPYIIQNFIKNSGNL